MGVLNVMTAVMIKSGRQFLKKQEPAVSAFSPKEVDRLHSGMLFGVGREELVSLRRKLAVTEEEMNIECEPGTSEWRLKEKRLDKLAEMMALIDKKLESGKK